MVVHECTCGFSCGAAQALQKHLLRLNSEPGHVPVDPGFELPTPTPAERPQQGNGEERVSVQVVSLGGDPVVDQMEMSGSDKITELLSRVTKALGLKGRRQQVKLFLNDRELQKRSSIQESGVLDGSTITAVMSSAPPKPMALRNGKSHRSATAVLNADGSVVAHGDSDYGGDCSSIQEQLAGGVHSIYQTNNSLGGGAFAALKVDGSVVAWGDARSGGDCQAVAHELHGEVEAIAASENAFAALKADGHVVAWGSLSGEDFEGISYDSGRCLKQLCDVQAIAATIAAFAALKSDGSVVACGFPGYGGDCSSVAEELTGVNSIHSSEKAFAAVKSDGIVVSWGKAGDCWKAERNARDAIDEL